MVEGQLAPAAYPVETFSDDDWQWLRGRCADLGLPDPDPQRAVFTALYSHLLGVGQWLNLTRIRSPKDWLKQHLLDSLSLLRLPLWQQLPEGARCLDLGSGGGYPGLPLMTMLPQLHWLLVDSRGRKVAFLHHAIPLTGCTHAEARQLRVGEASPATADLIGSCRVITARAVAQADVLLRLAAALLAPGGVLVLAKGPGFFGDEEQRTRKVATAMSCSYEVATTLALEPGDPERVILTFRKP